MGPGGSNIVVDTLTDNVNRALVSVRTIVTRKGGKMASVAYNFNLSGVLDFKGPKEEEVEEALVLGDVDVSSVTIDDDGEIEAVVAPNDLEKAKDVLKELGVTDFDRAETTLLPNEWIEVGEEDKAKLNAMMNELDEAEDVQAVYTNVSNL